MLCIPHLSCLSLILISSNCHCACICNTVSMSLSGRCVTVYMCGLSIESMDTQLYQCFMCALKTTVTKVELPLLTSAFFRNHMVPHWCVATVLSYVALLNLFFNIFALIADVGRQSCWRERWAETFVPHGPTCNQQGRIG